jgi:hypothetical protein
MRKLLVACVVMALGWVAITLTSGAQEAAKYSIKDVMQKAHKGGLTKKVAKGEASAEEKQQLLELYQALAASKPPRGDEEAFKQKAAELVAAAQDAVDGKEGAADKLNAIFMKCMGCHSAHKGK